MPLKVIGMLFGIPEADQAAIRDRTDANLRTAEGEKMDAEANSVNMVKEQFGEYVDFRTEHPSDDLISELITATFTDGDGVERSLTRQELLTYISVIVGAGNETTSRLIGWAGKLLAENPDQLRAVVDDRSLIPDVIEETLRYEPAGPFVGRYVTTDVELHDRVVPAGSAMLFLVAAANRDERRWVAPDDFDIHRERLPHVTFGHGIHFCLGASLARIQGRVALEELVARFPTWEIDEGDAELSQTSTVRGYQHLPIVVG